ncbi:MAG: hypothetical protein NT103_01490, partial [Campylobacterales bacterium]|nr:hypothetical protein [Campylobacterales bacterium]
MLRTIIIGKKIAGVTQLTQQMVMSGDKIVLVDEAGHAPKHITTKMVGKDLHIFADGMSEPSAILNDYSSFENSVQIQGLDQGGAYYDYTAASGGMALSSTPVVAPVAAPTPVMSTSAWWGVGILAVAGGVAAAAGGGGGGGSSTTTVPAATTLTASLVDSLVSGVSYTTSSGLTGVTLADGSLTYKTGDIVTFKVGNATIGTFNTANINPDHIITIQEIAGVARTNTTDTKVVNIA